MEIGASTACFYPMLTEKALLNIAELGFSQTEVFFNAPQETEVSFAKEIANIASESGIKIVSAHPFSSFLESSCIFGDYQRRFDSFIEIYEKTCHAAAILGAKFVVIHGAAANPKIAIPDEHYFERFSSLVEIGKREGVIVCQENVNLLKSQSSAFCKKMRDALGDDYKMVFDVKQTIRAGEDTFAFAQEFKNDIVHVHLSDSSAGIGDCLPPGKGTFDFKRLYNILGKDKKYTIEIYSGGYDVNSELRQSKSYLERI